MYKKFLYKIIEEDMNIEKSIIATIITTANTSTVDNNDVFIPYLLSTYLNRNCSFSFNFYYFWFSKQHIQHK